MWKRKATKNNIKIFPLIPNNAATTLIPIILEHLISFENKIKNTFQN
jgi:hypothetical protein